LTQHKLGRHGRTRDTSAGPDRLSRDVHFILELMAHKMPSIVTKLGADVYSLILHRSAALIEKERKLRCGTNQGVRIFHYPLQPKPSSTLTKIKAARQKSLLMKISLKPCPAHNLGRAFLRPKCAERKPGERSHII